MENYNKTNISTKMPKIISTSAFRIKAGRIIDLISANKIITGAVLLSSLALFMVWVNFGGGYPAGFDGGKGSPKKQEKGLSFAGMAEIKKIDATNKTLSVYFRAGSNSMIDLRFREKTFPIDDQTQILINGTESTLADVKEGDNSFVFGRKTFKSILNIEKIEIERK